MKLRYFVVDAQGTVRKARREAVEAVWEGKHGADALGCPAGSELRVISVLCDGRLLPQRVYLLRLPLMAGRFTEASYLTLRAFARPDCVTPAEMQGHHSAGWPADLPRQLAIALDVPLATLNVPLGVGGPLFEAARLRVTPRQALRHLR
jgi:hypothetical protein